MTRVSVSNLSKTYPGSTKPSLDQLSLEIGSGELVALLGPSGCGKTTALKLIAGLLQPSAGDIQFDGRSIISEKPENRGVVMVFQNHLLFPYMTVADNIGFGLKMRGIDKATVAHRVSAMLSKVKLPDLGKRKPSELSGGQQQRVALARALIVEPKVLLLDEPLSNLDEHLRIEMRDFIRSLQRSMGITTIIVTHDQEEAAVLANRVGLLLDGRLRQFAAPDVFYRRPQDREVAQFFGGQNFIPGESDGRRFTSSLGKLDLPPGMLAGAGVLTFRPEAVKIGKARVNSLTAVVADKIYLGTQTRLKLRVAETLIDVLVSPDNAENVRAGDQISVNLPPKSLWILREGLSSR